MPICIHRWGPTALSNSSRIGWTCLPWLRLIHTSTESCDYDSALPNYSNRASKRRRRSPSEALVASLERNGHYGLVWQPRPNSKSNLSYASPWTWRSANDTRRLYLTRRLSLTRTPLSLTLLVARAIDGGLSNDTKMPVNFTKWELRYLGARKYNSEDVGDWVSIILHREANEAARTFCQRDREALDSTNRPTSKPIPTSVFLIFLRRPLEAFDAETLRFSLIHAWHELNRKWTWEKRLEGFGITQEVYNAYQLNYPTMDDSTVMIMIVRLLRYARHVWPESLVTIAKMFTKNFNLRHSPEPGLFSNTRLGRKPVQTTLVAMYNRMLKLVSLPATVSPYLAVPYYRMAQFDILAKMADSQPPLPINREGYRSVISVHLASSKTDQEREWDDLKARSWPPWKEERTGLDAAKGADYGLSKALKALRQATSAGYGAGVWEKTAQVLSGWDIDGSPTIQTRAFQLHDGVSGDAMLKEFDTPDGCVDSNSELWAARVRATRTLQEAWAGFVAYKDLLARKDTNAKPGVKVYGAMLEKLVAKPVDFGDELYDEWVKTRSLSAGDGKEVFPTPVSPKESTYVRDPPPSLEELVDDMFKRKICPDGRTLSLIISNSPSFDHTLKYLTQAAEYNQNLSSLLSPIPDENSKLQKVSSPILTAFLISLLSMPRISSLRSEFPDWHGAIPLSIALRFIRAYKRATRSHYYAIMNSLTRSRGLIGPPEARFLTAKRTLERYASSRTIIESMHARRMTSDLESFRIECTGLEHAILSAYEVYKYPAMKKESAAYRTAEWILHWSGSDMHARFMQLMTGSAVSHGIPQVKASSMTHSSMASSGEDASIDPPRLLASPSPVVLYHYVRVLGLLRDYANLLAFVRWMSIYADEIAAAAQEKRNGTRMLRRCIIALRVFTEGAWDREIGTGGGYARMEPAGVAKKANSLPEPAAPLLVLRLIRMGVDKLEFGGWPSDEEVERYLRRIYLPARDEPPGD